MVYLSQKTLPKSPERGRLYQRLPEPEDLFKTYYSPESLFLIELIATFWRHKIVTKSSRTRKLSQGLLKT